jgi:signal peptidase
MTTATTRKPSIGSRVRSLLLTLAAIGGVVCIVLVLLAVFFHITLIMFKTGSMSPTIPEGSLAVVRQIPASQIHVGDVVTVDRAGELPISHRVTSIHGSGAATRIITLKGDANLAPDPLPYTVTTVRLVIWSVPQLAYFIVWLSNPLVLGAIAVGAAALVTWAFWPTGTRASPGRRRKPRGRSTRAAHQSTLLLVALVAGATTAGVLAHPDRADAAPVEQVIHGRVITLTSIGDPSVMGDMQPGVPALWQLGIASRVTRAVDAGTITLTMSMVGQLAQAAGGLQLAVSECSERWVGTSCASGGSVIIPLQSAAALVGTHTRLGTLRTDAQRWLLVTAVVPDAAVVPAGSSSVHITAAGVGDLQSAGSDLGGDSGTTAFTGVDLMPPFCDALAAIAVGLGLAGSARLGLWRRLRRLPPRLLPRRREAQS